MAYKVENNTLLVGAVGALLKSDRMWLDAFEEKDLSNSDVEILKQAKFIFTPSQSNKEILDSKCPDTSINISHKPWPYTVPKSEKYFENKAFILAFNRGKVYTDCLVKAWNNKMPPLIIVGARGNYPAYIYPMHEYLPYEMLLHLINNCSCLIDLPQYDNYISSCLHMALYCGNPIISTNKYIKDKTDCVHIAKDDIIDNVMVPSSKTLQESVKNILSIKNRHALNQNYNKDMFKTMSAFFV